MDFEQLYLALLPYIDRVTEFAARRFPLRPQELDDLKQEVRIKIWADDYAVLRKHRGASSMESYLNVVVHRAVLDHVIHLWGKWRPSKEAERLGPVGMALERLLEQEHRTFREAYQLLRNDRRFNLSEKELEEIARKLPRRQTRRSETSLDAETRGGKTGGVWHKLANRLANLVAPHGDDADARLRNTEAAGRRERVMAALKAALKRLPAKDHFIINLWLDGIKVADIARLMKVEQKPLYRRLEKIFATLRQDLERAGISGKDIKDLLGNDDDP